MEKEIKFKITNSKINNLFGKKTKKGFGKWYKNLTLFDKRILFSFLGLLILILAVNLTIEEIRNYNDDLSLIECNQLRIDDVRYYLEMQEENNILAFIYAFQLPFKLLIGAIAIAWILHGVGFHIIKR